MSVLQAMPGYLDVIIVNSKQETVLKRCETLDIFRKKSKP